MDDIQLGKLFQQKLREHEYAGFHEEAWQKLAIRLDKTAMPLSDLFLFLAWLSANVSWLFLMTMLALIAGVVYQQHQIGILLETLNQQSQTSLAIAVDTIYLDHSPKGQQLNPSQDYIQPINEWKPFLESYPQLDVPLSTNKTHQPSPDSLSNVVFHVESTDTARIEKRQIPAAKKDSVSGESALEPPVRRKKITWKHRLEARLALPLSQNPFSNPRLGTRVGLHSSFLIGSRLGLSVGLEYRRTSYVIPDLVESRPEGLEFANFPRLMEIGNQEHLDEIKVSTAAVEIPLSVRYYLPVIKRFRPHVEAGIAMQGVHHQRFTYEYQNVEGHALSIESGSQDWLMGSYLFAAGIEFPLSGRLWGRTQFFYQKSHRNLGVENLGDQTIGLAGSIWFQPGK